MEIVVLNDTGRRLFHAVLSVSLNGGSYILDNMLSAGTGGSALDHVHWLNTLLHSPDLHSSTMHNFSP